MEELCPPRFPDSSTARKVLGCFASLETELLAHDNETNVKETSLTFADAEVGELDNKSSGKCIIIFLLRSGN